MNASCFARLCFARFARVTLATGQVRQTHPTRVIRQIRGFAAAGR
jgi:hypothetical protein